MGYSSVRAFWACTTAIALALISTAIAEAQPAGNGSSGRPRTYQRRAFEQSPGSRGGHGRKHWPGANWQSPPVNAGWFQRPYPYHLDYYRMRYGGSYAPYFGNLYGPPQVVTAPPYYGPYFGGFGFAPGPDTNFGYDGPAPGPGMTNGTVGAGPLPGGQPVENSNTAADGEPLPPPAE